MIVRNKDLLLQTLLLLVSAYYVYDQLVDWAESGEIVRYIALGIPVGVIQFFASIWSMQATSKPQRILAWAGLLLSVYLLIPPSIIYKFFIN
jgi:hypothetical protein